MSDPNDEVKGRVLGGKAKDEKLSPERKAETAKNAAIARRHNPRTSKVNDDNDITMDKGHDPRTTEQLVLPLHIEKQIEIDGVGMGVLSDGTAFLTGRGLARLCGVDSSRISEMGFNWNKEQTNTMAGKVKELLRSRGIIIDKPCIEIKQRSGSFYAYSDAVCLAVLEYYAFDAPSPNDQSRKNFRILAGKALYEFICTQVGYDPKHSVPNEWRQFHDRVSLTYNSIPKGYFGIFKEMADMIVTLGQAGLQIDSSCVPDISVGYSWGKHWTHNDFDTIYRPRQKWDHNYPSYFPQAESNPQPAWCYPDEALGEFRRWLRDVYIGKGKFQKYITDKVRQKELPVSFAQLAIAAYSSQDGD